MKESVNAPNRSAARAAALGWLTEHVGAPAQALSDGGADPVTIEAGGYRFRLAWTASGAVAAVEQALRRLATAPSGDRSIPVVATTFMGEAGAARCKAANVGWLDLSGNASLRGPGLRVEVRGAPNRFVRRGRPANPFAPKSARVARWLLMHPHEPWRQRDLAAAVGLSEGAVSKVVRAYEADGLIARDPDGAVAVTDPPLLLDAWRERYRFDRHSILAGTMAARSGVDLTRRVTGLLRAANVEHAFTGLAAAWWWDGFANFRTTAVFVDSWSDGLLRDAGFVDEPRGANLWLVTPDDAGVFHGASQRDGVPVVHPVQAYLDLGAQAERAAEAAEHLRAHVLSERWGQRA